LIASILQTSATLKWTDVELLNFLLAYFTNVDLLLIRDSMMEFSNPRKGT